ASPLIAGVAVAAAALAGKYGIEAWHAYKARPRVPRMRKFYEGGFQPVMTRREAALILGVRESAAQEKVKEAHRRVMIANHPDAGDNRYKIELWIAGDYSSHFLGVKVLDVKFDKFLVVAPSLDPKASYEVFLVVGEARASLHDTFR
ncbi:hypothetical protein L7F22_026566, partial [Adiantum nelumboides]|nr:hypothetical protein [Adiantum nelumboides]